MVILGMEMCDMMMDEMGVLGGLIGACVGRWIRIHAMPHTFLPTTNPPFPCASFPFPLSPSIPTFILHFHSIHSFPHCRLEREGTISSSPQTKRGLCPFPIFLFLFSITSTPQYPHFPPLSLLSFFSLIPSFSPPFPRWHHPPHVTIPANNQSRLDARTPSAPIVASSTNPTTPLDATNANSPCRVQPTDLRVSHRIGG